MFPNQPSEWGDNSLESIFEAENSVFGRSLDAQPSEYWRLGEGGENFGDLSLSSLLGDSLLPEPGDPTCWSAGAILPAAEDMNTCFDFQDPTLQGYIDRTMQDLNNTEFCGFIEKAMKDQVSPGRTPSIQNTIAGPSNSTDGLLNKKRKRKSMQPAYKEFVNTFATMEREQIGPVRKMQKTHNQDLKMQFSTSVSRWTEKTASARTKTEAEKKSMMAMTGNVCVRCMILKIKCDMLPACENCLKARESKCQRKSRKNVNVLISRVSPWHRVDACFRLKLNADWLELESAALLYSPILQSRGRVLDTRNFYFADMINGIDILIGCAEKAKTVLKQLRLDFVDWIKGRQKDKKFGVLLIYQSFINLRLGIEGLFLMSWDIYLCYATAPLPYEVCLITLTLEHAREIMRIFDDQLRHTSGSASLRRFLRSTKYIGNAEWFASFYKECQNLISLKLLQTFKNCTMLQEELNNASALFVENSGVESISDLLNLRTTKLEGVQKIPFELPTGWISEDNLYQSESYFKISTQNSRVYLGSTGLIKYGSKMSIWKYPKVKGQDRGILDVGYSAKGNATTV